MQHCEGEMPKLRKPPGWPANMTPKQLADGSTGYYWSPSSKDKANECPIVPSALGRNYGIAVSEARYLNDLLRSWRLALRGEDPGEPAGNNPKFPKPAFGTLAWLVDIYLDSEEFEVLGDASKSNYRTGLARLCAMKLKEPTRDMKVVGHLPVSKIKPRHAKTIYRNARGASNERLTTAGDEIKFIRRAWNIAWSEFDDVIPESNPFKAVEIKSTGKHRMAATLDYLTDYVDAAKELGHPSMALAGMIGYYWVQRETDIIQRMTWQVYDNGIRKVKVRHNKTKEFVWLDLDDTDGSQLFPEIETEIQKTPKRGTLMVMQDKPTLGQSILRPYSEKQFNDLDRMIRKEAGLPAGITFATFRTGGLTEAGDAGGTDTEIMATSAHQTREMLTVYTKRTNPQAQNMARKRLAWRRAREQSSKIPEESSE